MSKRVSYECLSILHGLRRMAKDLSEGVRRQIIALTNEGYSQREIAAKMGVSKGAVQRTWKGLEKRVPTPVGKSLEDQEVLQSKKINPLN